MTLNRDKIVAEAMILLEEGGLAEVSLRKLAARLSVKAPALARHVGNKDSLVALMAEAIFRAGYARIGTCDTWQDWLKAFGRALWEAQADLRDSAQIITVSPSHPAILAGIIDDLRTSMGAYGLSEKTGIRMQSSVQALVGGWLLYKQSQKAAWIDDLMGIEESFHLSLDALVEGWTTILKT